MAPLVDACPVFQEHVYQFAIGLLDRDDQGRGAEGSVAHGLVEPSSHGWEGGQHLATVLGLRVFSAAARASMGSVALTV